MKQFIALMALLLIKKNGQTTNLEIKNGLRHQFANDPNFKLYQSDVSKAMDEIAVEHGLVVSYDQVAGHQFRVFSLPAPPTTQPDDTTSDGSDLTDDGSDDLSTLSSKALNGSNLSSTVVGSDGSLTDSTTPTPAPAAVSVPSGFGPQVDEAMGEFVAYWFKDPTVRAQGNDKNLLRSELTKASKDEHPDIRYDDTRVCSAKFYNKNVAGR